MKKIFISVLAMAAFVLSVSAQQKVYVWQADGNVLELNVSNIDSISFTAPNPNVSRSVATFEDVALGEQGFWNGSDLSGSVSPQGLDSTVRILAFKPGRSLVCACDLW